MSMPKDKVYKRIFLLGPSHHEWLDGASVNMEADYYARRENTHNVFSKCLVFVLVNTFVCCPSLKLRTHQ